MHQKLLLTQRKVLGASCSSVLLPPASAFVQSITFANKIHSHASKDTHTSGPPQSHVLPKTQYTHSTTVNTHQKQHWAVSDGQSWPRSVQCTPGYHWPSCPARLLAGSRSTVG